MSACAKSPAAATRPERGEVESVTSPKGSEPASRAE
jgi:hypothetical protein